MNVVLIPVKVEVLSTVVDETSVGDHPDAEGDRRR